jgi:O-antigen/teichoic acid export membrane protein
VSQGSDLAADRADASSKSCTTKESGEDALSAVLTGGTLYGLLQVANAALVYGTQVLFANCMSVPEFGRFAFAFAWAALLAAPASLGVPQASVRFIPEYAAGKRWTRFAGFLVWSRWAVMLGGVLVALLACVAQWLWGVREGSASLYLGFVAVPLLAFSNLQLRQTHALGWPVRGYVPQVAFGQLGLLVLAGIAVGLKHRLTAVSAMGFLGLLYVAAVATQAVVIAQGLPRPVRGSKAEYSRPEWLRVAVTLLAGGVAYSVLERSDVIMLGMLRGPADVAIYSASAKTALMISFGLTAAGAIAAPRFASLYAQGRIGELESTVRRLLRWLLWPTLAAVVGVVFLGRRVLGIFGEAYVAGYVPLVILAIGQFTAAFVWPGSHLLNVTGHERAAAWALTGTAVLNVLLNLVLIPAWGPLGASVGTAVSLGMWNLVLPFLVWRRLGVCSALVGRWPTNVRARG